MAIAVEQSELLTLSLKIYMINDTKLKLYLLLFRILILFMTSQVIALNKIGRMCP